MKNWNRKDYGKNAVTAILGGVVCNFSGIIIIGVIGDVLFVFGLILTIIWLYKKISNKE